MIYISLQESPKTLHCLLSQTKAPTAPIPQLQNTIKTMRTIPPPQLRSKLDSLSSPSLRRTKQKSNDVLGVLIELIPFRLALSHNGHMPLSDLALQQIEQVLTDSASEMLNQTYIGRCQDVDLNIIPVHPLAPTELAVRTADLGQWKIDVRGNVTFSGSYYLDDPESEEVSSLVVESWIDDGLLMDTLSSFLCSEGVCLQIIDVELLDTISEVEGSEKESYETIIKEDPMVPLVDSETDNTNPGRHQDNIFDPVMAINDMDSQTKDDQPDSSTILSRNAENVGNMPESQNHVAWIVPVILVLTMSLVTILFLHRRRRSDQTDSSSNNLKEAPTLEASPSSSPLSILRTEADKAALAATTKGSKTVNSISFHQKSIDQLLQEFTNDDISLVSDPSTNDASEYSVFSGFSHDLLSQSYTKHNSNNSGNDSLNLKQAALASSTLHDTQRLQPNKKNNKNYDKTASYLPSPLTLQKQESFEGKYRTISAMASVLRKDILHVAGETGEDSPQKVGGAGGRTSSPRKSMEMMERQKMREKGLMDSAGGDITNAAVDDVGRVGIRPANKEELEEDKIEVDDEG